MCLKLDALNYRLYNIRIRRLVASSRGAPQFNVSCANASLPPSNRPRRPTRNSLRTVPNLNCNVYFIEPLIIFQSRISVTIFSITSFIYQDLDTYCGRLHCITFDQ